MSDALAALAATLQEEGGLVAQALSAPSAGTPTPHGDAAAAGPRARGNESGFAQIVEAVREGHLTHAADGPARIVTTEDPDLALLVGDRLYALGLAWLAELGDLEAVGVLADTIALGAQAHAVGDPALAQAAFDAGAQAVGHGATDVWSRARDLARAGDPSGASALSDAARQLASAGAIWP